MVSISRMCYLQCVKSRQLINLPGNQLVTLGRNKETEIVDKFVSKRQIEFLVDNENFSVKVKPIGNCVSGSNGYALMKNKSYTLQHGDNIEFRLGFHQYDIIFKPPPPNTASESDSPAMKKRKLDYPIFTLPSSSKLINNEVGESHQEIVGKWEEIDDRELLIYTPDTCLSQGDIAAFDIDGTITKTKSGARFPKSADDWILNFTDIPSKLTNLFKQNFKIVFFTNQSGIGKDLYKIKEFKSKIENIVKTISVPIQVFIATGKTKYRKPVPGMWEILTNKKNGDITVNFNNSFYVGDAAGRDKKFAPNKKNDHSKADRLFALNIGLKFYTPEEYFLKASPVPYNKPEFDPRDLPVLNYPDYSYNKPNIIIMVGCPGSGKSYFCKTQLVPNGYHRVNRDMLGSWQKCVALMEEKLLQKINVVIDNTNVDKKSRERYITVAKKFNADCRCFVMSTSILQCKHNNKFREITDKSHIPVSDIIINSLKKNYEDPEMAEGFTQILQIPFIPKFDNEEHEKLYKLFLLEK